MPTVRRIPLSCWLSLSWTKEVVSRSFLTIGPEKPADPGYASAAGRLQRNDGRQ